MILKSRPCVYLRAMREERVLVVTVYWFKGM